MRIPTFTYVPSWRRVRVDHLCKHDEPIGGLLPVGPGGWTVQQVEPLTVRPSIHCLACGMHGFIRNGAWVPA